MVAGGVLVGTSVGSGVPDGGWTGFHSILHGVLPRRTVVTVHDKAVPTRLGHVEPRLRIAVGHQVAYAEGMGGVVVAAGGSRSLSCTINTSRSCPGSI